MFRPFSWRSDPKPKQFVALAKEDEDCAQRSNVEERIDQVEKVAQKIAVPKVQPEEPLHLVMTWTKWDTFLVVVMAFFLVFVVMWLCVGLFS